MISSVEVDSSLKLFTDAGYRFRGLVHVGANDGAEIPFYRQYGASPIICFEPHPEALARATDIWGGEPGIFLIGCGLSDQSGSVEFIVPIDGDDEKTSRYLPIPTDGHDWTRVAAGERIVRPVMRFDEWARQAHLEVSLFDALVVDVQGMEMEVLQGFGEYLPYFTFLAVEMSEKPMYEGEAPAAEIIHWLDGRGFMRVSEVHEHDDVLFIHRAYETRRHFGSVRKVAG